MLTAVAVVLVQQNSIPDVYDTMKLDFFTRFCFSVLLKVIKSTVSQQLLKRLIFTNKLSAAVSWVELEMSCFQLALH